MQNSKDSAAIMGYHQGSERSSSNEKKGEPGPPVRSYGSDTEEGDCHIRIHPNK